MAIATTRRRMSERRRITSRARLWDCCHQDFDPRRRRRFDLVVPALRATRSVTQQCEPRKRGLARVSTRRGHQRLANRQPPATGSCPCSDPSEMWSNTGEGPVQFVRSGQPFLECAHGWPAVSALNAVRPDRRPCSAEPGGGRPHALRPVRAEASADGRLAGPSRRAGEQARRPDPTKPPESEAFRVIYGSEKVAIHAPLAEGDSGCAPV